MKILLFDPNIDGHHSDYMNELVKYFIPNVDKLIIITDKEFKINIELVNEKVRIYPLPYKDKNIKLKNNVIKKIINSKVNYNKIRYIEDVIKKEEVDIIHILSVDDQLLPISLWKNRLINIKKNAKVIGTIHSYRSFFALNQGIKGKIKNYLSLKILKHMDNIYTHSSISKDKLVEAYKLEKKIKYISYGTKPYCKLNKDICKRELGLNEDITLLIFGQIRKEKGIERFVEALQYIKFPLNIIVAGNGDDYYKQYIDKYINRNKNIKYKNIIRFIDEKEIPIIFGASDVLILPYDLEFSGQSGPLTIATTYGLPIIATEAEELARVIKKNNLGLVSKLDSPMELSKTIELFNKMDISKKRQMEINCKNYANNNTWSEMCNKILEIYRG